MIVETPRPLVVLLRRPDQLDVVARRLRGEGWTVQSGWDLPDDPWDLRPDRWLCSGTVTTLGDAELVLACLRRTSGAILAVDLLGDEASDLLADLHRVADLRAEATATATASLPLSAEQRELLTLVAHGASVPEAAASLFLSPRTAERRLAAARTSLGVRSTAQAIARLLEAESTRET